MKWQTQVAIFLIVVGGGLAAYKANVPPFTKENKDAIKKFLSFGGPSEDELDSLLGPGDLYTNKLNQNNPQVQLNNKTTKPPAVKADPRIREIFAKNVYKQLFLPYDRYPFLYDNNYLEQTRDAGSVPFQNPQGIMMNYRPPLNIGGSGTMPNSASNLWSSLYEDYGYYPPGGSYNNQYDSDFYNIDDLINIGQDPDYGLAFLSRTQGENKNTNALATTIARQRDEDAMLYYNAEKYKNSEKFKRDEFKRQGIKIGEVIRRNKKISIQG